MRNALDGDGFGDVEVDVAVAGEGASEDDDSAAFLAEFDGVLEVVAGVGLVLTTVPTGNTVCCEVDHRLVKVDGDGVGEITGKSVDRGQGEEGQEN